MNVLLIANQSNTPSDDNYSYNVHTMLYKRNPLSIYLPNQNGNTILTTSIQLQKKKVYCYNKIKFFDSHIIPIKDTQLLVNSNN